MPTTGDRKYELLALLRGAAGWLPGETLGEALGISRVAVWKHIRGLRGLGYRIESSARGYLFGDDRDQVSIYDFPDGSGIRFVPVATSTMDLAAEITDAPDGTVALAERQTRGRGRMARPWSSESGGLYFTVILKPSIPLAESGRIGFAAALALRTAIFERTGLECTLKWPNDLLLGERKIAGILTELRAESGRVMSMLVGIGVNLANEVEIPSTVTVREAGGRMTGRIELLETFRERFRETMALAATPRLLELWRGASGIAGKQVTVVMPDRRIDGVARAVDDDGALVIETADGTTVRTHYGDLFS